MNSNNMEAIKSSQKLAKSDTTSPVRITGAEAVLKCLVAEGVDLIFGYPGGAIMPFYDALYGYHDKIKHILTRHEQGAIHAAQGFARVTRRTGVAVATSGPGATNLFTGLADALMDSTPLVCITGQVFSHLLGSDAFQEVDVIGCTTSITKWNHQVTDASEIPEVMAKAFRIANSGRPGPVLIDITKNAQIDELDFVYEREPYIRSYHPRPKVDTLIIKDAAQAINNAKKPLILAGHGIHIAGAKKVFNELVEKTGIPVGCTIHGLSTISTDHPLYAGMLGMHGNYGPNVLTNSCDVLIAIGMRFDDRVTGRIELEVRQSCAVETFVDLSTFIQHYSSIHRLQRATCWIMKFLRHFRGKTVEFNLTVDNMEQALWCVIRFAQKQAFGEEIKALTKNKEILASSKLQKLRPVMIEGLLCVGGRLENAGDGIEKHPIILANDHLATLLIRDVHEKNAHAGSNYVLSQMRRKYHALKDYSAVKSVLNSCVQCKKHHGQPMQQVMGDLPKERVDATRPPFTFVGVDYFGPMNVKYRRGTVKRYGCIFTCLTTRAVHFEVAHSLDSDSFLMALHRFIARRGKPQKLFSDNGTNFVAAERELAEEIQTINSSKLRGEMLLEAIEWSFNPPHAPHMGGAWERLIRSVKEILRHLVGDRLLTDEELVSFLCEAERILNDRPLTRMGSDAQDPTPLTPNHLLLMRENNCTPNTEANHVRRQWQVIQKIANVFYERFISEYLPQLQVRSKWTTTKDNLKTNDLVLVMDEDAPRGQWPMGVVTELEHSSDGCVRAATVRCNNKEKRRSIHKLVLLERHDDD